MKFTRLLIAALTALTAAAFAASDIPKEYPLKTCPVSGEELGSGGMKPAKVSHDGTEVWLCCSHCKPKFEKDPAKYTKPVKDAAARK
jgi:YHS domain-containing protein